MMNRKWLDTVTAITCFVLLPLVVASLHACLSDRAIPFDAYASMWSEPLALLLGFWLRNISSK